MLLADYPESNFRSALKALACVEQVTVYCASCERSSRIRKDEAEPRCPICSDAIQEVRNPNAAPSLTDRQS